MVQAVQQYRAKFHGTQVTCVERNRKGPDFFPFQACSFFAQVLELNIFTFAYRIRFFIRATHPLGFYHLVQQDDPFWNLIHTVRYSH